MEGLSFDLRAALRSLRQHPGYTAVAMLTLALGIGATTAIFSVVNGILLQPLPYAEPDELMTVWLDNRIQGWPQDVTSYPNYLDWRAWSTRFEDMAAWTHTRQNLTGLDEPLRLLGITASPNLLSLLGVEPALGRIFTERDWELDPAVVVLSSAFWQQRFGRDPGVLGARLSLDGQPYTVVGVMPPDFAFGSEEDAYWRPFAPTVVDSSRRALWLEVVGRLRDGVDVEAARADMDRVGRRMEETYPEAYEGYGVTVVPLLEDLTGDVRAALWVLLGAVVLVLLIACANVANLSLARAADRQREMAVRAALGACRGRLLRQTLTESALLAAAGCAGGVALAYGGVRLLEILDPDLPRLAEVGIDATVLAFALTAAAATALLAGLAPALRASRPDLSDALKEAGRSAAGSRAARRLREGLVVAEIALALVLLVAAGLLMRSYAELRGVDVGFRPGGLLMTTVALPSADYPDDADSFAFFQELIEGVRALPGVTSVAAVGDVPLGSSFRSGSFTIAERAPVPRAEQMEVKFNVVTPGYFETMGIPLVAGRTFEAADSTDPRRVVIVNRRLARMYFPDQEALGARFLFGRPEGYATPEDPSPDLPWFTIVGVVADVPQRSVRQPAEPEVYAPYAPGERATMTLVVRTSGPPEALAAAVRRQIWNLDADLPVSNQAPVMDLLDDSSARERLNFRLLGLFAAVSALLAAIGIYGVMSYAVSRRTREIGIRMALGAERGDTVRVILRTAASFTLLGLGLGLLLALAAGRLLSSLLFGVGATDPITFVAVTALLGATALAASLVPTLRAARLDPIVTLRDE